MKNSLLSLLALGLCASISSCGSKNPEPAPSLYDRVGKSAGVSKIVNTMITNVVADCEAPNSTMLRTHAPMIDATKAGDSTRLHALRMTSIDLLAGVSGGPAYTGKSMQTAHAGLGVTSLEFDGWRALFAKSLDQNKITGADKQQFLEKIDGMRTDVVNH